MRLADDARHQHGMFSRRQALDSGLSARQLRRRLTYGIWTEPVRNVYADAGLLMTPAAWRWASLLSGGPQAVLSHRSAAEVWDMPVTAPPRPEISVPVSAHARPGPQVKVHRITVPTRNVLAFRRMSVTSRQRTVLDCLLDLPVDQGRTLFDRALQRGWVNLPAMVAAVHDARGRRGVARARAVMAGADPATASQAERVAQGLLAASGITGWVAGHPLLVGGQIVALLDLAFPAVLLAIEIDGWAWHSGPERFQRDRRRQNLLVSTG